MNQAEEPEEEQLQPVDFYAILNLSRQSATEQDVKAAYKRAILLYHPDKHRDECKELAETKFQLIQRAYEGKKEGLLSCHLTSLKFSFIASWKEIYLRQVWRESCRKELVSSCTAKQR